MPVGASPSKTPLVRFSQTVGCRSKWSRQPRGAKVVKSPGLEGFPALVTRSVSELGISEMLTDHRIEQERWARENRQRRKMPRAFGMFIASLAAWDWFLNPLSFRDRLPGSGPPVPEFALGRIKEYLLLIQRDAGQPIGWTIAEEFGRFGGRYHCHVLVTGVAHLSRDFWRREAHRRFGYTRIDLFDPARGAAYYSAKYEGRLPGQIHLGGTLAGTDLSKCEGSRSQGGGQDVAISVPVPKNYFHLCLPRRHR